MANKFTFIKSDDLDFKRCWDVMNGDDVIDTFGYYHDQDFGGEGLQNRSSEVADIIYHCDNVAEIKKEYNRNYDKIMEVY